MIFSDSGIDWATRKLRQLSGLHGFPEDKDAITARAKALLRIAHPVVVAKLYSAAAYNRWEDGYYMLQPNDRHKAGPRPKIEKVTSEDWLADWEALEAATITHDKIGEIHPVDWLLNKALDVFKFCPAPVELREIFSGPFPCADGANPSGAMKAERREEYQESGVGAE